MVELDSSRAGVPVFSRPIARPSAVQPIREPDRRRLAEAARRDALVADVDHALQERAGGEDDAAGAVNSAAVGGRDAGNGTVGEDQVLDCRRLRSSGSACSASAVCMASR